MTTGGPTETRRPDPDALLAHVANAQQGRLKIFLGMAPGVGKTYEMLRSARKLKAEGHDVLVGVVETHGRKETEALLRGLEILPRKSVAYKGRTLSEFDLDAALARKPKLLLVDEYAHSNAPDSRHPKRWQDVAELLSAGIDVWTTLNVQHLESLVDVVWKITGVQQKETVPDHVLKRADEIELVDLTPSELRRRLAEGKVYVPETARLASEQFFKLENLTALRELALRRVAQTVDDQLVGVMKRMGVQGPWSAGERILVLIRGDDAAATLVRAGRRLSDMMMDAPWSVAHIARPGEAVPTRQERALLSEALSLAEQLGATLVPLSGSDYVDIALDYCGRNNITQIVLGAPKPLRFWRRSLVQAFLKKTDGVALHIVTHKPSRSVGQSERKDGRLRQTERLSLDDLKRHFWSNGFVILAGLTAGAVEQLSAQANLAMVFLLAVLAGGLRFGLWPSLTAAATAAFIYNFFFLDPRLSVYIGHPADVLTFFVFFVVAVATGWLSGRVREQVRSATAHANAIRTLLSASRSLSAAATIAEAALQLQRQLEAAHQGRVVVFTEAHGELKPQSPEQASQFSTTDATAVRWAYERAEAAGKGTGTLPSLDWAFYPIKTSTQCAGVVALEVPPDPTVDAEINFLKALIDLGAVALERARLAADAAEAQALRRSDQLKAALLNSISHDLRTPLSTVLGASTTLLDYGPDLNANTKKDLLVSIRDEAERLSRYVGDLLDMTRLEGGALTSGQEWLDLRDVLNAVTERVRRRLDGRKLCRDFPDRLSLVQGDPHLLEQALVNVLDNAIVYTEPEGQIDLSVYEDATQVVIAIDDDGPGVAPEACERIFEKFTRLGDRQNRSGGAGLGLAITKGFIEAMAGRVAAVSPIKHGRGTRILISLPKRLPTHEYLL